MSYQTTTGLVILYENEFGKVFQNQSNRKIVLELNGEQSEFNLHCFFAFKRKIDQINLADLICKTDRTTDDQIINACGCDRCFVFTLQEIIQLKDLLGGTKTMMELNSILYERIYSSVK